MKPKGKLKEPKIQFLILLLLQSDRQSVSLSIIIMRTGLMLVEESAIQPIDSDDAMPVNNDESELEEMLVNEADGNRNENVRHYLMRDIYEKQTAMSLGFDHDPSHPYFHS